MDIPKYKWHSRISIDLHIYINAQHISSAYFISSHTSGCYNDDIIAMHTKMALKWPIFFILFCRTLDLLSSHLYVPIAFDEAQKHDSITEKCSFIQNSLKRWILLLYLSINLTIVPSIKTGIVCELHSSADFIESALSARWIIQYEVNTSLSIDVFHFQWHFYLQSVQWLWLNVLITCDC